MNVWLLERLTKNFFDQTNTPNGSYKKKKKKKNGTQVRCSRTKPAPGTFPVLPNLTSLKPDIRTCDTNRQAKHKEPKQSHYDITTEKWHVAAHTLFTKICRGNQHTPPKRHTAHSELFLVMISTKSCGITPCAHSYHICNVGLTNTNRRANTRSHNESTKINGLGPFLSFGIEPGRVFSCGGIEGGSISRCIIKNFSR